MAGPIQIGDIIKFSEMALQVWKYGWEAEHNAGENYRAFGAEVGTLYDSLKKLDTAVIRTQQSLRRHGARESDLLGADRGSLDEIIGDYKATLQQCQQLLDRNRRYSQTTSPLRNIEWNFNVMPQVDHLRNRIRMHTSRIEHVLKPFEIDLISNIHADLVRRLSALRQDIFGLRRDINTIMHALFPEVAQERRLQTEQQFHSLKVPDYLSSRVEAMFDTCSSRSSNEAISLRELTDCFLIHLEGSTVQFHPDPTDSNRTPPPLQYLELLKCQYLLQRIGDGDELDNLPTTSHWRGYVTSLQEKLSEQCARFDTELSAPDITNVPDELLSFRFGDDDMQQENRSPPPKEPRFTFLLEASLASEPSTWRMLQLRRRIGSDTHFRTTEIFGHHDRSSITKPRVVDFDIHAARLIPIYADPTTGEGSVPPLEIIIEENDRSHSYVFLDMSDLLQFQEALTGFEVVDGYTESHARAVFLRQSPLAPEKVTIQIWIPSHLAGIPDPERQLRERPMSPTFHHASNAAASASASETNRGSRSSSMVSALSGGALTSSTSRSSTGLGQGQEEIRGVRIDGRGASTAHGMIRSSPRNPLLVFFTLDDANPRAPKRSFVAVKIDDRTRPNPSRCDCYRFHDCRVTALVQQSTGFLPTLRAQRLENNNNNNNNNNNGGGGQWNLLPLAEAPEWRGVQRISILFPSVEARRRFSGHSCDCPKVTEGDVEACISQYHEGLLGIVRVYHRRQMMRWQEQRDKQVALDHHADVFE